jgi:hypothetical protein
MLARGRESSHDDVLVVQWACRSSLREREKVTEGPVGVVGVGPATSRQSGEPEGEALKPIPGVSRKGLPADSLDQGAGRASQTGAGWDSLMVIGDIAFAIRNHKVKNLNHVESR